MGALRILLLFLCLLGIATCLMARLNDALLMNLPSVYSELVAPDTSADRQSQLMQGLTNSLAVQQSTTNSFWWVGLGSTLISVLAMTLRPRNPAPDPGS